jgi:CheY-like chemotaxis protein
MHEPQDGATRLTVATADGEVDGQRPEPRAQDATAAGKLRVLIVEDNADSRLLLGMLLEIDGYEVRTAPDGQEGFNLIAEYRPDVALIDLGLPGMDGLEVARKVRGELHELPTHLVALTGYGRSDDRAAVFAAGFDDHLVKPVAHDELTQVLRKLSAEPRQPR